MICFMQGNLTADLQTRNSIYMMLTRSFITSYFVLPDEDREKLQHIITGVRTVNQKGYLHIQEPSDAEKRRIKNVVIKHTNIHKSQRDIVEEILDELEVPKKLREKFHGLINSLYKEEFDRDKLYEIIQTNYNLMD